MKYLDLTKRLAALVIGTAILVGCNSADDSDKTVSDLPAAAAQSDSDNDGIPDGSDNCPKTANVNQTDTDGDNTGDACDSDLDGDGILNASDNCPMDFNPDQKNTDPAQDSNVDGKITGDVCDPFIDRDEDGIAELQPNLPNCGKNGSAPPNCNDNCPTIANANQLNSDGDNSGNACEDDTDQDGILDDAFGMNATCKGGNATNCNDNCINVPNPGQHDDNWNSIGDGNKADPDDKGCEIRAHCEDLGGGDSKDLIAIVLPNAAEAATCSNQVPQTCTTENTGNTIDADATNFGVLTVSDAGGQQSVQLSITGFGNIGPATLLDIDNDNVKEDGRVGFVIDNPTGQFSLEFSSVVEIATYLNGTLAESTDGGSQLQIDFFGAQTVPAETPRVFLAISPITKEFDEVRLTLKATAASAQLSRNVFGACYSNVFKKPVTPPGGGGGSPTDEFVSQCRSNGGPAELCDGMEELFGAADFGPDDLVAGCKAFATTIMQDPSQCDNFSPP